MIYKIPPWKHQLEAIERAKTLKNFALFFEMGTGKTGTCINILRHKFNASKRILKTLIFCPPIVVPNWIEEWKLHSDIQPNRLSPLYGSQTKRLKILRERADLFGERVVFVTNYESLLMEDLFKEFQKWSPEVLVFDESHKLKSGQAKRSQLAEMLSNPYAGKTPLPRPETFLLTGSPILNSPMDLFQQFLVLDGGATFGRNFFAFRARYFRDRNTGMPKDRYFPKWEPMVLSKDGIDALGEMTKAMEKVSMRVEKKDCLDLPEELEVNIKLSMSQTQAKAYEEMKRDFITFLDSKACTATLALTKALRLMQITSGFLAVETHGEEESSPLIRLPKTPKQEALRELLESLPGKVLVWAVWKENYMQIKEVCESLSLPYVEVHGGIPPHQKHEAVRQFQEDARVRVFIGHPGAGGIGINLVHAPNSIFFSRTFSLEQYLQAKARNHRGGQKEKVTHYHLVCENTIDEILLAKLKQKIDLSETLLKDLGSEIRDQRN